MMRFGVFEVDRRAGELRKGGVKIRLQDQPLQILLMLLERPGEVVTREEVQNRLWPSGTVVEFEHSISTAIKKLRQALGDDAETPRYVETLPRRGFRFIFPVGGAELSLVSETGGRHTKPRKWWPLAGAAGLILVAGIAAILLYPKHEGGPAPLRPLTRLTFDDGLQFGPTWSPDGKFIAYSSDRGGKFDIWVQQVGAANPVKITTRAGHNWEPDWSPDGTQIVFRSEGEGGGLFVVPALGGPERKISSFGYRPRWSPNGSMVLFGNTFVAWLSKLYVVGLDGGPPREVLTEFLKKSGIAERYNDWYPNSNRVSIMGETAKGWGFWTVALDGTGMVESRATDTVAEQLGKMETDERQFRWGPSGNAIYFEGEWSGVRNLWKMAVDHSGMRFVSLERLTAGPGPDAEIAISSDGKRLAYAARSERVRIWSYPFDAKGGRLSGEGHAVTPAGVDSWQADISTDGKRLLYLSHRLDKYELWETILPDGPATLLKADKEPCVGPRWSPDSRRVACAGLEPGAPILVLPEGGGAAQTVTSPGSDLGSGDWTPDGQWIVANRFREVQPGKPEYAVMLLPLAAAPKAEAKARLVTASQTEGIYEIRMSPNGKWVVLEAVTGGVAPGGANNANLQLVATSGGPWTRVGDGEFWDDKPRWAPDGKTIYFISSRTGFLNVWGIRFDPEQGRPQGQPFPVTTFESPALMVADNLDLQSLSLSGDRLVLSMKETSGNIWALDNVDR